jgi:GxxExxY protein
LLESVYENTLAYELTQMGLQVPLPVFYKKIKMEVGFRIDLLVENKVIVELKAIEALARFILHKH